MKLIRQSNGKVRLDKGTHEDRIAGYYMGHFTEEVLSEADRRIMQRWNQVWSIANHFYSPWQAIRMHMKKCKDEGNEISQTQAFYDYKNATRVFGDVVKTTKDAKRALLEEFTMKALQMSLNSRDLDNMNKAITNLIKIAALDRDTPEDHNKSANTMFVMNVYTKGSKNPKIINLDELDKVDRNQQKEILEAVEDEEVTEVEMEKLLKDGESASESE